MLQSQLKSTSFSFLTIFSTLSQLFSRVQVGVQHKVHRLNPFSSPWRLIIMQEYGSCLKLGNLLVHTGCRHNLLLHPPALSQPVDMLSTGPWHSHNPKSPQSPIPVLQGSHCVSTVPLCMPLAVGCGANVTYI